MISNRVYLQFSALAAAALVAACGGGSETAFEAKPSPALEGPREAASTPAATPAAAPASAAASAAAPTPAPGPTTVQCDGTVRQWFGSLSTSVQFVVPSDARPVTSEQCNHFSIGQNRNVACTAKIDASNQVSIEVNGFPVLRGAYVTSGTTTWRMGAEDIPMTCNVPAPAPGSSAPAPFVQAAPTPPGSTPPPPPPPPREAATAALWITPSGINAAQCYQSGTSTFALCSNPATAALNPRQEGHLSDTPPQMSYSQVRDFPLTSCVKDNLTGLIWEGKESSGPRAGGLTYSNYDSTTLPQFSGPRNPTQLEIDASTNSLGYVKYVNSIGLCGFTDWRRPTADELLSIVDFSRTTSPTGFTTLDPVWFPNATARFLWTSTRHPTDARFAQEIWYFGAARYEVRAGAGDGLRLVRGTR